VGFPSIPWKEKPAPPGHPFYERLNAMPDLLQFSCLYRGLLNRLRYPRRHETAGRHLLEEIPPVKHEIK
jgi:hypothetical protein